MVSQNGISVGCYVMRSESRAIHFMTDCSGVAGNVLRLCVCLPLAQGFNLTINLMGQIAQNRCYLLGGFFSRNLIK